MAGTAPRHRIERLHLWLGLVLGGVFAIIGLTGSALVFQRQIDTLTHPAVQITRESPPQSWDAVLQALRVANPDKQGAWRIEVSRDGGAVPARYMKTAESAKRGFAPLLAWVDPASNTVVRQEIWGGGGLTWIYDLHYRLLAGEAGGTVIGVIGLILLVLMVTGLTLWWPTSAHVKAALTLKLHTSAQRRVYDIHVLIGVYSLVLLLGVTLTGTLLDLPGQVKPLLAGLSSLHKPPALRSTIGENRRIPVDRAVAIAARQFPGARLAWIETPEGRYGTYRINLAQPWEPSQRFPRTNVWIDQYDGQVLGVRDPAHDGAGDIVLNWLHPLHNGEAFGMAGRVLMFVAGLLPAVMFVTGVIRWRHKERARLTMKRRKLAIRGTPETQPAADCGNPA